MRRRMTCLALLGAAAATAALLAAGATGATEPPAAHAAATKTVVLKNIAFNPGRVTIERGDRVAWAWRDGRTRHNVTSRSFRSSPTRSSGAYAVRFSRTGTFSYRCTLHPGMNGVVTVKR